MPCITYGTVEINIQELLCVHGFERSSIPFFSLSVLMSFLFHLLFSPVINALCNFTSRFLTTTGKAGPIIKIYNRSVPSAETTQSPP